MRARDYDYVYSVDPNVLNATFDEAELLMYTELYRAELEEWMNYPIGKLREGRSDDIDYDDFRRRADEEFIRTFPPYNTDTNDLPEGAYYDVFSRLDKNSDGRLTFKKDKFQISQDGQTTWKQFMKLYE